LALLLDFEKWKTPLQCSKMSLLSTDQGGGKWHCVTAFCHTAMPIGRHLGDDDAMLISAYVAVGFLIVCILAGTKALSVDTASTVIAVADQIVVPDTTQSPRQPSPGEDEDLLSTLD
jgi:hypothetical protein